MTMRPSLRQLEYLVAIADHGSFHAAARATHVSQPGLSAQVAQLEETLGARLFERDRRRVLITPAGAELAERARRVLVGVDDLVDAAAAFSRPLCGRLRLGVIPTVAPYLLPRVMPALREAYPELTLLLHEAPTADLVHALERGELDLLLLALEAPLDDLRTLELFEDDFFVAVPRGHRLAGRKRVQESDIAHETVLLLDDGHCLREQALAVCAASQADEADDFRASSLATLVQVVASGEGITLLPAMAAAHEAACGGLETARFRKPSPHRTIGLAWRATSQRAEEYRLLGETIEVAYGHRGAVAKRRA